MPDEVEEFLRRVVQMRAQAEAQAKGQQQKQPQQQKKSKAERKKAARQQQQPPPLASRPLPSLAPLSAEVVEPELAERSDRVGRLVDQDLRETQQIAEHSRRLGADVDAADDKMAAHLHQTFDHQLGRLKSSSVETTLVEAERSASELSLDQIRRMLRSPGSVRDAIVMAEILKRPDF